MALSRKLQRSLVALALASHVAAPTSYSEEPRKAKPPSRMSLERKQKRMEKKARRELGIR